MERRHQGGEEAVSIEVGKVKKTKTNKERVRDFIVVIVHNHKYKTAESQSIDWTEDCSHTSL